MHLVHSMAGAQKPLASGRSQQRTALHSLGAEAALWMPVLQARCSAGLPWAQGVRDAACRPAVAGAHNTAPASRRQRCAALPLDVRILACIGLPRRLLGSRLVPSCAQLWILRAWEGPMCADAVAMRRPAARFGDMGQLLTVQWPLMHAGVNSCELAWGVWGVPTSCACEFASCAACGPHSTARLNRHSCKLIAKTDSLVEAVLSGAGQVPWSCKGLGALFQALWLWQ